MNELPPLEGEEVEQCFGWHALNYRTAATEHAEEAFQALTAFVRSYALSAVQMERERCAKIAEMFGTPMLAVDPYDANLIAAAIRSPSKEG